MEASVSRWKDSKELRLGIQIQGSQYRRFLEWEGFHVGPTDKERQDRLSQFIQNSDANKWLFDHDSSTRGNMRCNGYFQGETRRSSQNTPYCSYSPFFIYRYIDIVPANVRAEELPSAVAADLEYASELIGNSDYVNRFS